MGLETNEVKAVHRGAEKWNVPSSRMIRSYFWAIA